jgi:hypothetical protein
LLCLLGKEVPPLNWIIQWYLLYPCGVFPNAAGWACFFINFIYLLEFALAFLIFYYFIDDLYDWFVDLATRFWQIYLTARMALQTRRDYLTDYNEMQLSRHYNTYVRMFQQRQAMMYQPRAAIGSEMGGDVESGRIPARTRTHPSGMSAEQMVALHSANPRLADRLLRIDNEIEEKHKAIAGELQSLASEAGAHYAPKVLRGQAKPKPPKAPWRHSMHSTWERVTQPLIVPMRLNHSYISAVVRDERAKKMPGLGWM